MLSVARTIRADIEWRQGDAASLPFADGSFDAVLSQMALMFLPDRPAALGEMARVVTDVGTVAVIVPGALDPQPAFEPFVELAGTSRRTGGGLAAHHLLRVRRARRADRLCSSRLVSP